MARVLLIGAGPLPGPKVHEMGFPQLRLARFQAALRGAGHHIDTLCLGTDIDPQAADWLEQLRQRGAECEVVVSAGPYLPGMAACLIAGERPVWVDLPGDPFAELQAAWRAGVVDTARHAAARAAALAVLSRADAISVISRYQRYACLGQLGVLDRLNTPPHLAVQPIAYDWPFPRRNAQPKAPVVIALSGGFNTWFDDRSAATLLEAVLESSPQALVVCTGGAIAGHYAAGARRFADWARSSRHAERITMHGWLPHAQLPAVLAGASTGLIVDHPGAEPLLGSRTRALMFAWLGIQIAATPGCALLDEMAEHDLILALSGHPDDAERLLESGNERAARADAWLQSAFPPQRCFAPMLAWLEAPVRTPAAPTEEALVQANARLSEALARIHQSPTWRLLSPLHQALRRLTPGPR